MPERLWCLPVSTQKMVNFILIIEVKSDMKTGYYWTIYKRPGGDSIYAKPLFWVDQQKHWINGRGEEVEVVDFDETTYAPFYTECMSLDSKFN